MFQRQLSFGEAISICFNKYCTFAGRASRSEYWWWTLFNFIVGCVLSVISEYATIASLALLLPGLGVFVRRMHDIGRSGWWYFFNCLPLVGSIILIVWCCKESEPADNQYGPVPYLV